VKKRSKSRTNLRRWLRFLGGREGYWTLLNTNMKRELEHLAKFLHMA